MEKGTGKAGRAFKNFAKVAAVAVAAAGAATVAFAVKSVAAYNKQIEAQTKLSTNLLNVAGNSEATVKSLTSLASALQSVGVIGDEVVIAGMSQLATFNLQGKTIETLTPKIVDMVAQLKGHNATTEDFVNVNNLVGKVMSGNVGSLSRYGITLNKTQGDILKNGTESEKAAALVEVLSQNFGDVNKALRNTPQGRVTALKNEFGDFQELIGEFTIKTLGPVLVALDTWLVSVGGVQGAFDKLISSATPVYDFFVNLGTAVGNHLAPKLKSLWEAIQNNVIPNFTKLYNGILIPLATFLGTTLVFAIGFAIDAFTKILEVTGYLIAEFQNANPVVVSLTLAFAALGTALLLGKAFAAVDTSLKVMKKTTIPGVITKIKAMKLLIATPMVMPAIVVAAAIGALVAVFDAAMRAKSAIEQLEEQKDTNRRINDTAVARNNAAQASSTMSPEEKRREQDLFNRQMAVDDQIRQAIQNEQNQRRNRLRGRAAGGPVSANTPYVVGENRDGSLNSTSELFVPRQSGSIVNSSDFQDMMGGSSIENNIGTINIASDVDADSFLKRLTQNQEIIGKGLTPATAY